MEPQLSSTPFSYEGKFTLDISPTYQTSINKAVPNQLRAILGDGYDIYPDRHKLQLNVDEKGLVQLVTGLNGGRLDKSSRYAGFFTRSHSAQNQADEEVLTLFRYALDKDAPFQILTLKQLSAGIDVSGYYEGEQCAIPNIVLSRPSPAQLFARVSAYVGLFDELKREYGSVDSIVASIRKVD